MSGLLGIRVAKKLGSGSFGDVFEAERDKQLIALKIVSKEKLQDQAARHQLVREVEIHSELHHDNLVDLLDFFEDDDRVYLVMELCERGELLRHVRKQGGLPESEVCELFSQMVEGIAYLHDRAIIHRDIKLANILLTASGKVKIADFGLAAVLEGVDSERSTICGTPNYISPEIASQQSYSLATDVWSLGVALHTMLCGAPPFQDDLVAGTLQNVRAVKYRCPEKVSLEAADLLTRMLCKDPAQRPRLDAIRKHPFLQAPLTAAAVRKSRGLNDSCFSLTAHLARLNASGALLANSSTAMTTAKRVANTLSAALLDKQSSSSTFGHPSLQSLHNQLRQADDGGASTSKAEQQAACTVSIEHGKSIKDSQPGNGAAASACCIPPNNDADLCVLVERTAPATDNEEAQLDTIPRLESACSGISIHRPGEIVVHSASTLQPDGMGTSGPCANFSAGYHSSAQAVADSNRILANAAGQDAYQQACALQLSRRKRFPGTQKMRRMDKENQAQTLQQGFQRTGNPRAPTGLVLQASLPPAAPPNAPIQLSESRCPPTPQEDAISGAPGHVRDTSGYPAHRLEISFVGGWVTSGGYWTEGPVEPAPRLLSRVPQPSQPPSELGTSWREAAAAAERSSSAMVPYQAERMRQCNAKPCAADWPEDGPAARRGRRETMTGSEPTAWLLDRSQAARGRRETMTGLEPTPWLLDQPQAVRGRRETMTGSEQLGAQQWDSHQEADVSADSTCNNTVQAAGGCSAGREPAPMNKNTDPDGADVAKLMFLPETQGPTSNASAFTSLPSTARLTPQTHRTPHGLLALLPDGSVCVEHPASRSRAFIAGDSSWVHFEQGNSPALRVRWADVPIHVAPFCATAAAFVRMLADATPRIVYLGSMGRTDWMESGAAIVTFDAGTAMHGVANVRIEPGCKQAMLSALDGELHVVTLEHVGDHEQPLSAQHPQSWQAAVAYALRSRQKCEQLEAKVLAKARGSTVLYPLIARNRHMSCSISVCSTPR